MAPPITDKERFALLAKLATEAWLQSRAALIMTATGSAPSEAAEKARAAFEREYGGSGIDISYFRLEKL